MSTTEILVIAFGLVVGYWVVAKLIGGKPSASPPGDAPARRWPEVLNVAPAASVAEIRAAYEKRMDQCHPDEAKEISAAYRQALAARGMEE